MLVNNKKNRVILTILVIIITYLFLLVFLKIMSSGEHSLCIFKLIFKKECPGCGMTRAFYNMLKFNVSKAIDFNKKIVIVYPLVWGVYISFIYKKTNLVLEEISKNGRKKD